jgi:hypothetical protein
MKGLFKGIFTMKGLPASGKNGALISVHIGDIFSEIF